MHEQELIEAAAVMIREHLARDSAGHDWWHIERVWRMAKRLAVAEGADLPTVELAALLHDLDDWKFADGDHTAGERAVRTWLEKNLAPPNLIEHVCEIVRDLSFKGAGVATPMRTLEGQVVQDADRLDAIGALGIARAFAYGGHKGRLMHDPTIPPTPHEDFATYKKNQGPTLNHFYEKLLLLQDRMNTNAAKQVAAQRHTYMEQFLAQFLAEWDATR
jgi:uncharacterized protein